jgi:zinc protease
MRRAAAIAAIALLSCHKTPFRFPSDLDEHAKFHYDLDLDVFTLSNGLTVVLAPARDTNVVVVDARYEVGSADDPIGQTGIAHFIEHLTFLERAGRGAPTVNDRMAASALSYNAFTSFDSTDYVSLGLADRWTELLAIEAARMTGSCDSIDDALLERERGVVLAELAQRNSDATSTLLAAIFGEAHPYGHAPGGADVATVRRADVCAFLAHHYAPDHAVVVVSGAIDEHARATVTAAFAALTPHGAHDPPGVPALDPTGAAPRELTTTFEQPIVALVYPAPAWGSNAATYHALAERLVQRAMNKVDAQRADIDTIEVFELGGKRGGATLVAALATKGADLAAVEKAMRDGMSLALVHSAADEMEIGTWRAFLYARFVGKYDDLWSRGSTLADYVQLTDHGEFQIHDLEVAHAMSAPELLAYTDHFIAHATPLVVHIRPEAKGQPTARIENTETRPVKDLPSSRQPVDEAEADHALPAPAMKAVSPDQITLPNGLRVVFAPRPGSSLFEARMVFPAGSADDPPNAPGAARLAAAKIWPDFQRPFTLVQWDEIVAGAEVGTSYDSSVTESSTVISTSGVAAWAQWHLWHLHLELEAGIYDPADLKHETGTTGDDTEDARRRAIMARLFGADHPYARASKAAAPDAGALEQFRRAHYVTEGATLVISGSFDRAVIEHDIRELWGAWPKRAPTDVRAVPAAAPVAGPTVFVLDDDDASQVHVEIAVLARSTLRASRPARAVAIQLLDLRLAAIREEMAASYGVSAGYDTTAAGDLLVIGGDVEPARAADALVRIDAELVQLRDHAADLRGDFVRARRTSLSDAMAQDSSAAGAANEAQSLVVNELPLDYFSVLPSKIGAVTPADAAELLHGDLDPARMVIVISGPGAREVAEAAKLGPITDLPKAKKK